MHHKSVTDSTNSDARSGVHGDVFTADFQSAGRGRLDHKWLSAPGENLMMSVVLSVGDCPPGKVATFPLVVGLSVAKALSRLVQDTNRQRGAYSGTKRLGLKWPNDVLYDGRKLAGILCERCGDNVVAGIGVNVNQSKFEKNIENRAVSLKQILSSNWESGDCPQHGRADDGDCPQKKQGTGSKLGTVPTVRDVVLEELGENYERWKTCGFDVFLPLIAEIDLLKGRTVSVAQTDSDDEPITGLCTGIADDGALLVGKKRIYAGEAHILSIGGNFH